MIQKTILVLPSGQLNINNQIVSYDDKFRYIEDNFQNPNIPETQVIMNGGIVGHAIDYKIMDDGLYCTLELNDNIEISNKYPYCQIEDYINDEGVSYKFYLKSIILKDKPQYEGNQYKELSLKLKTKTKDGFVSPAFPDDMPEHYQDILASAYASCRMDWIKDGGDRESKENKQKCSQIAWGAVKRAGYKKSGDKELQVPNPNEYNNESEWMQVCIPYVMNEGLSQEEAKGKCYGMWQNRNTGEMRPIQTQHPDKKSKIDVLGAIKKLVEKNGYAISDEKILEMFGVLEEGKGTLTRLNKKLDLTKDIHDIQVFPRKKVYIEKYDQIIDFNDVLFDQMIDAFNCEKLFRPFGDEEHQLGVKYFDILDLYKNAKGFYAKIQLNERGKLAIKNNDYSYISPEWGDRVDTDGQLHKNVLWAITLTNIPALEGENPKLQDQIKLNKTYGGKKMDLRMRLSNLEGRVSNYKLADEAMPAMPPEIMEAIQMIKDALMKIDELTQQNQQVVEEKDQMADKLEVADKLAEKYKSELDTIETEKSEREKDDFFEKVVSSGQLEASEVEDYKLMYDKAKDIVVKLLTSKPKKENYTAQRSTTSLDANDKDVFVVSGKKYKLTQEDYDIMEAQKFDKHNIKDIERYVKDVLVGMEE